MTITFSSGMFQPYFDTVDALLEEPNIGRTVTTYYETKQPCRCNGYCEECYGSGVITNTDTMQLRLYNSPRDWLKTAGMEFINGRIQVLGYMTDVNKLKRATYVMNGTAKYILTSEPLRHGFGDRYFVAFLDLI